MSSTNSTALADRQNETRVPSGLAMAIVCPAVALVFVTLRLYTRAVLLKHVFWEDYVIIGAMVFSITMSVFMVIAFSTGSGRHMDTLSMEQITLQLRISPGVHVNYIVTHMLLKLSISLHYTRISVMPFEKRLCYALTAVLVSGYIALIITSLSRCIPFEAIWNPKVPGAVCLNQTAYQLAFQVHTMVMDFIILIVPLFILRHLTIPWPQRVLLGIILGFGGMACIVSVLRVQVIRLSTTSTDKTWDSFFSALYGTIEPNLGIACACIVTLRPLLRRWRWLPGGEAEKPQVELEQGKPRRNVIDKDHIPTITDSTQVLTISNDVELGAVDKKSDAEVIEVEREFSCAGSTRVDKNGSCAGSINETSGQANVEEDLERKGSPRTLH